jgi:hypothetical protein
MIPNRDPIPPMNCKLLVEILKIYLKLGVIICKKQRVNNFFLQILFFAFWTFLGIFTIRGNFTDISLLTYRARPVPDPLVTSTDPDPDNFLSQKKC